MAGVPLIDMEARSRPTGEVGAAAPATAVVSGCRAAESPRRPAAGGIAT